MYIFIQTVNENIENVFIQFKIILVKTICTNKEGYIYFGLRIPTDIAKEEILNYLIVKCEMNP